MRSRQRERATKAKEAEGEIQPREEKVAELEAWHWAFVAQSLQKWRGGWVGAARDWQEWLKSLIRATLLNFNECTEREESSQSWDGGLHMHSQQPHGPCSSSHSRSWRLQSSAQSSVHDCHYFNSYYTRRSNFMKRNNCQLGPAHRLRYPFPLNLSWLQCFWISASLWRFLWLWPFL